LSGTSLFLSFCVSLTTVGIVLTLYLSYSRLKNEFIKRSVDPKLGALVGLARLF